MTPGKLEFWLAVFLVFYLLTAGVAATVGLALNFPTEADNHAVVFPDTEGILRFGKLASPDQGLILMAFLAGMAGSFLHAAQSLISFLGNGSFRAKWTAWYFLRPWIGAVLGVGVYIVFRAGLVGGGGASAVNPFGVVALGLLAGWFSKTTTDKLQEVFETLFKTDEDRKRMDKLRSVERPVVDSINPSPVPSSAKEIIIVGCNFQEGATVLLDNQELQPEFVSDTVLRAKIVRRPAAGTSALIQVKNPAGEEPASNKVTARFE